MFEWWAQINVKFRYAAHGISNQFGLALLFLLATSCTRPMVPSDSQLVAQGPPQSTSWWCDTPRGYYPSVPYCSTPWHAINAAVAQQPMTEPTPVPSAASSAPTATLNLHHFSISIGGGVYPIIDGSTDLPDGTQLFINLVNARLADGQQRIARGLPACGDPCWPATGPNHKVGIITTVQNGRFTAGPFSFDGKPFRPAADYPLTISIWATDTPEEIRATGTPVYVSTIQVNSH